MDIGEQEVADWIAVPVGRGPALLCGHTDLQCTKVSLDVGIIVGNSEAREQVGRLASLPRRFQVHLVTTLAHQCERELTSRALRKHICEPHRPPHASRMGRLVAQFASGPQAHLE